METAGYRGKSRRQEQRGRKKKIKTPLHFDTVRFGGFDETQIICCLWELVKAMEAVEAGKGKLPSLKKQLHSRIRVELRRYFARKKRRNMKMIVCLLLAAASLTAFFGAVAGIDRVSGNSMYPYLNHGDWILYSRVGRGYHMGEVVVFDRKGTRYVKRIAGLPGDTVEISASGGRVVVNGAQMRESYVTLKKPEPDRKGTGEADYMREPLTVMDGQYLVLGDNRSESIDSRNRDMGTVPEEEIRGRVIMIVRRR